MASVLDYLFGQGSETLLLDHLQELYVIPPDTADRKITKPHFRAPPKNELLFPLIHKSLKRAPQTESKDEPPLKKSPSKKKTMLKTTSISMGAITVLATVLSMIYLFFIYLDHDFAPTTRLVTIWSTVISAMILISIRTVRYRHTIFNHHHLLDILQLVGRSVFVSALALTIRMFMFEMNNMADSNAQINEHITMILQILPLTVHVALVTVTNKQGA